MSRIFSAQTNYAYRISRESPDKVYYNNDYLEFMNDDRTPSVFELLVPLYFDLETLERNIIGATLTFLTGQMELYGTSKETADAYLEIYSIPKNQITDLCYNSFYNKVNKRQHVWADGTTKLKKTLQSNTFMTIELSDCIQGIEEAVRTGNGVIIKISSANALYGGEIKPKNTAIALNVKCASLAPVVSNLWPNGNKLYKHNSKEFSWTYDGDGSPQKTYEIGWKLDGEETWNTTKVTSTNPNHIYAEETFPEGKILWRLKVTAEEGLSSAYVQSQFNNLVKRPKVSVEFPDNINIQRERTQIFIWNYEGEELEQASYEIGWSSDDGATWNTENVTSSEKHHVFEAETFPTGRIRWRIRATNSAGYEGDYSYGEFGAIGQSEAPIIESVSQNAIPTITWTASNQEAFEVKITGREVNYESGMIGGKETRSFQPNIMLSDGTYVVKVRILNIYGMFSEWGETAVVLTTNKPNSEPSITLLGNELYGARLSGSGVSGKGFFVRKEAGKETIIAEHIAGEEVIDCNLQPGKTYSYVLRDCLEGYIDSDEVYYECYFSGVLFHDKEDLQNEIHILLSDEEYVEAENVLTKNTAYKQCIGREFSIKETNSQKTEEIHVKGFLNKEQYQKAYEMYCLGKTVLFRHENHCCYADISSFKKQKYFDKGYIVEISFVRLDESNEVKLV